jgi:hypothetical protein
VVCRDNPRSRLQPSTSAEDSAVRLPLLFILAAALLQSISHRASFAQVDPASLTGIVIDDADADLTGDWTSSTSTKPYLGESYIHDGAAGKGEKSALFTFTVPESGKRHVLIAYSQGSNRAKKVPITIEHAEGETLVHLDEMKRTELGTGFTNVGEFPFKEGETATISIGTAGTTQHVIVDGIRLLTADEFETAKKKEKAPPKPKPVSKKPTPPRPKPPVFARPNSKEPSTTLIALTSEQLQKLLTEAGVPEGELVDDVKFLRRVSLDLVGRQPTLEEYRAYLADKPPGRRQATIDRLLASPDFGRNQANYWSDVIGSRQQEPQLTFHDYTPFRAWLTEEFNSGKGWDEIVFQMVTSVGTVGERPQSTFIGFHQGDRNRLAGETTRVFLSLKIACAQCHDHPFVDMPQEQFHGMAAFFARTTVKIAQNNSNGIDVQPTDKGEHKMPGGKEPLHPTFFQGDSIKTGISDLARREQLGYWLVGKENPYFARSFTNHIWARLMGRGFYDPIDHMGEGSEPKLAEIHDGLAGHFAASGFDPRSVFRVILNSKSYQRAARAGDSETEEFFSGATPKKLRGDEVFDSLAAAIELPDIKPPIGKKTSAVRFPIPPKSTRDLVNEAFGFDPSTQDALVTRTMKQAMFLINNAQIRKQVDGNEGSETVLARLLKAEPDNNKVIDVLYARVLTRLPSDREREIVSGHVKNIDSREEAFEDVLWSLLNSAEFTTRN